MTSSWPNSGNRKTRATTEEEVQAKVSLLDYARWISEPGSLRPLPSRSAKRWIMQCPFRLHPGKIRTFVVDLSTDEWFCTACLTGGDVVDLAAKLNRFSRREAAQVLAIFHQKTMRGA